MGKLKIRHLRWYIVSLLCFSSIINYLDRQTLSVLAKTLQEELNFDSVQYSYMTTSFLVSYIFMYAVSGRLMDRLGTRRGFALFASGWSFVTILHSLGRSVLHFSIFRFFLGATEPANFPGGVKAVSEWFPMKERALAVGIFNSGTAIGNAISLPIVAFVALAWGWRWAFVVTGAIGFVWVLVWLLFYRLPAVHPNISEAERALITAGDLEEVEAGSKVSIRTLLSMKETWGCIAARFFTDPISYFLAFWIPDYLERERGFSLANLGTLAWIPYAVAALGNIASGAIPRYLIARGWSLNRARKSTMLIVSCLMPVFFLMVTQVESWALALVLISAITFGHAAWGNITLPAEVFPRQVVGSVSGFGGALGGLAGAATQPMIGWAVQTLSYTPVFAACSGVYLVAFLLVHFLIGELGVIRRVKSEKV
ncbi:MAG: MFS transporter [Acidobacteria bacterium]|nr:MAG: MFS transporter [Acidobacteriota bacterium]